MSEANKALFQKFMDEVIDKKNAEAVDGFMSPDFVDHSPAPGQGPGREGVKELIGMLFQGFPDMTSKVELMVAEGDIVVGHMSTSGTHTGEMMGIPATGKKVTFTETHFVRIADGKAVEHWGNQDDLGMMQQLGVIPTE